jgi:hypothetical protein
MVNIYDSGYMGNPENRFYVFMAQDLEMDWKECREMHTNLHEEVRQELDKYLVDVRSMKSREYLRHLRRFENRPSTIIEPTTMSVVA